MKYDNLFADPNAILSQRLNELPGEENVTMKQAGYRSVWKNFLEEYFQSGWGETVKQASLLRIEDSLDPFIQGQREAVDTILAANKDQFVRGWYSFVKEAFDATKGGASVEEFCKEAQLNVNEELTREEAGFLAASQNVLESDHDLIEIAWNGPNTITETEQMNAFEMGKEAAYEWLLDHAIDGASVADCLEAINETVNSELDKYASQEDTEYRLGVETFCYDFLKEAAATYGEYDLEYVDESDVLEHIFTKVAGMEITDPHYDEAVEFLNQFGADDLEKIAEVILDHSDADFLLAKIAARRMDKELASGKLSARAAKVLREGEASGAFKPHEAKPSGFIAKTPGGRAQITGKGRERLGELKGNRRKAQAMAMWEKGKKYGPYAAGAAGLAALGGGAYAYKRHRDKQEEQDKAASLEDPRVRAALAVLDEAGLLDD